MSYYFRSNSPKNLQIYPGCPMLGFNSCSSCGLEDSSKMPATFSNIRLGSVRDFLFDAIPSHKGPDAKVLKWICSGSEPVFRFVHSCVILSTLSLLGVTNNHTTLYYTRNQKRRTATTHIKRQLISGDNSYQF